MIWLSVIVNVLLTILKAVGGWASSSPALITDEGNSFSDLISDVATLGVDARSQAQK